MTDLQRLISRLGELEFKVREKHEMFGQETPMLRALAVDSRAHQLVLVAEEDRAPNSDLDPEYDEAWRQLLFSVAGLRHHLRGAELPACGAPVLLALVGAGGEERLHGLVEGIAEDYALFSRVDINIVRRDSSPAQLDSALAPLLPRVREALREKITVASQDVETFWRELELQIETSAEELAGIFGKEVASDAAGKLISQLRPERDEDEGGGSAQSVRYISDLKLRDFRSFDREEISLPPAAILHGANGSGKTSVCEAMEILWSDTTMRMPEGTKPKEYTNHLNHQGRQFELHCEFGVEGSKPKSAGELKSSPTVPLGRSILPQHGLEKMASGGPKERFTAFLAAAGLDLPDFQERAEKLRKDAHFEANNALEEVGLAAVRAVNMDPLKPLRTELGLNFDAAVPARDSVDGAAAALTRATDGAYAQKRSLWKVHPNDLAVLLSKVEIALSLVRDDLDRAPDPSPQIGEALSGLKTESSYLVELASPLRRLSQVLRESLPDEQGAPEGPAEVAPALVPADVAARWLSHARGLEQGIPELEGLAGEIEDEDWRRRLTDYVAGLQAAAKRSSVKELEAMVRSGPERPSPASAPAEPPMELLVGAGFVRAPRCGSDVIAAIDELHRRLVERAASLDELAAKLARHPAPRFIGNAARVMPALCGFALARNLLLPAGAVTRARETLVKRLLDERSTPVVRELVNAMVRFEWYFEPMGIDVKGQKMRIHGLASPDPELDVRFMLNEAERTVVGIAFFLALHVLQPESERRVLVLDDPAAGFDAMNKAAFIATLRTLLRLLRPEQFLITTHDDAMVALMEQGLATVNDWPADSGSLRCRRGPSGNSEVTIDEVGGEPKAADLERELRVLRLNRDDASPSVH